MAVTLGAEESQQSIGAPRNSRTAASAVSSS